MAKKDVTEMTVEEKLKNLYQLQTMLSEIDKIRTLRGELPLEVQDLEDEIEGLTHRIEKYNGMSKPSRQTSLSVVEKLRRHKHPSNATRHNLTTSRTTANTTT